MVNKRRMVTLSILAASIFLTTFSCSPHKAPASTSASSTSTYVTKDGEASAYAKRIAEVSAMSYEDILKSSGLSGDEDMTNATLVHMLYIAFNDLEEPASGLYNVIQKDKSNYDFNFDNIGEKLQNEYFYFYDRSLMGREDGIATYDEDEDCYNFDMDGHPSTDVLTLMLRRISAYTCADLHDDFYSYVNKDTIKNSTDYSGAVDSSYLKSHVLEIKNSIDDNDPNKKYISNFEETLFDEESKKDDSKGLRSYLNKIYYCSDFNGLNSILKELFEIARFDPFISVSPSFEIVSNENNVFALFFNTYSIFSSYDIESKSYLKSNIYKCMDAYLTTIGIEESSIQSFTEEYLRVQNTVYAEKSKNENDSEEEQKSLFSPSTILNGYDIGNEYQSTGLDLDYAYIKNPTLYSILNDNFSKSLEASKFLVMYKLLNEYVYAIDEETRIKYASTRTDENILATSYTTYYYPYIGNELISSYSKTKEYDEIYDKSIECLDSIKAGVRQIFEENTWLSKSDKEKMCEKLDALTYNMMVGKNGETNNYAIHQYYGLDDGKTLFDNLAIYNKTFIDSKIKYVGTKDKTAMTLASQPLTANAFNAPCFNHVQILPGYVLQIKDFTTISNEELYADLGYVIGHEFMHSFDELGFMYDKDMNYNTSWVSSSAAETFHNNTSKVSNFYSTYEEFPLYKMNGKTKLNEAVADIEGFQAAINAAAKLNDFDYDKFFKAFAKMNATVLNRVEYVLFCAADSHPISQGRCNPVLMTCSKFQEYYEIKECDLMYLSPENSLNVY